jgi:hypothetical protein
MLSRHSFRSEKRVWLTTFAMVAAALVATGSFYGCDKDRQPLSSGQDLRAVAAPPTGGTNNLSYPVIWAEGVQKTVPGSAGTAPVLSGAWWYWWGTEGVDPDIVPLSCEPMPPDYLLCVGGATPGVGYEDALVRAYLQKDLGNVWQAGSGTPADAGVAEADGRIYVDWVDWGDNLESVDWYTRSQVRTEVVLFKDNPDPAFVPTGEYGPWLEYGMRHTSGWGIDEVHGLAASLGGGAEIGSGTRATVYSPCARFMIQSLNVPRDDARLADLVWVAGEGWTEPDGESVDLIDPPIFNKPAWETGDGPGYYSAEINVKGRIIYGYTWNVRQLNDGAGDYRLTFSFDNECGGVTLNTGFEEGYTQILLPLEEVIVNAEETGGGGVAVLDYENNLTFIDVRILNRGGGGKDRPDSPGGGGGGGGGKGGHN